MGDLLKFIVRHANLLVLMLLEVVALVLVLLGNPYPRSTAITTANTVVATQYQVVSGVYEYFSLRSTNAQLAAENAQLRNELSALMLYYDRDQAIQNGEYVMRGTHYVPARVVQLSQQENKNYLTIDVGRLDGVADGMGVRDANGVVGVIARSSDHFSLVIPVIHPMSQISCAFQKDGYLCNLAWDGKRNDEALLCDVALHEHAEVGDTIVTSGLTEAFAADIPVGVVISSEVNPGDSYYTIRVRLATDFHRIRYVQVVKNQATIP